MIRKFYEADHGYDNSGSFIPSGGKSAEEVLRQHIPNYKIDHYVWPVHLRWDMKDNISQLILAAMEEYASQYAHQQPVQGYAKDGWSYDYGFLQTLTSKVNESEWGENLSMEEVESVLLAIGYNQTATKESIANKISDYLFVNTGIEIEKIIDIKLAIQSMLSQQPVNDGWVRVEDALPERGERVISVDENYTVECSYLNVFDEWKRSADGNILRNFPTHWRTLPEPPKQTPQTVSNMKEDKNTETKTWLEIMREFKPNITEEEVNYILWEHTCFPFSDEITIS